MPKLRINEWAAKDVMLPILGKNKTALLHSIEQFDLDSISNQKVMINQPRNKSHAFRSIP